jgi:hypothetical protein
MTPNMQPHVNESNASPPYLLHYLPMQIIMSQIFCTAHHTEDINILHARRNILLMKNKSCEINYANSAARRF